MILCIVLGFVLVLDSYQGSSNSPPFCKGDTESERGGGDMGRMSRVIRKREKSREKMAQKRKRRVG